MFSLSSKQCDCVRTLLSTSWRRRISSSPDCAQHFESLTPSGIKKIQNTVRYRSIHPDAYILTSKNCIFLIFFLKLITDDELFSVLECAFGSMELGWTMRVLWTFTQLISGVVLFYRGDETLVIAPSSLIPLLPSHSAKQYIKPWHQVKLSLVKYWCSGE